MVKTQIHKNTGSITGPRLAAINSLWLALGILGLGFGLRLLWLLDPGHPYDIGNLVRWTHLASQTGIKGAMTYYPDRLYWPLAYYLMAVLGQFNNPALATAAPALSDLLLLRFSLIACDLFSIALLCRIGRQYATPAVGLLGALGYALWPGSIYTTGWWGQIESWYLLPLLLGIWWLTKRRLGLAWLAIALALGIKSQVIAILPIFVVGTWRWWGWRALVKGVSLMVCVWVILFLPLGVGGLFNEFMVKATVAYVRYISNGAHNLWYALIPATRTLGTEASLDINYALNNLSFYDAGLVLAGLFQVLLAGRLCWRSGPRSLPAAAALAALGTAMLSTQMGARYYMAALALFLMAGLVERRWWVVYGWLAGPQLINLIWETKDHWAFFRSLTLPPEIAVYTAWINVGGLGLATVLFLVPWLKPVGSQRQAAGGLPAGPTRREKALLAGGLLLSLAAAGVFLGYRRQRHLALQQVRAQLYASLQETLATLSPDSHFIVANWPMQLSDSQHSFGLAPSSLLLAWPESLTPTLSLNWEAWAENNPNWSLKFAGKYIPQEDLRPLLWQADRVINFNAATIQMYILAQKLPRAAACQADFGAVCLAAAQGQRQGSQLKLELTWQINRAPEPETAIFVHVWDTAGQLAAQGDGDLVHNMLPLADWSAADRALRETRWITVPPGSYTVKIGLYNRTRSGRLPVTCQPTIACEADSLVLPVP